MTILQRSFQRVKTNNLLTFQQSRSLSNSSTFIWSTLAETIGQWTSRSTAYQSFQTIIKCGVKKLFWTGSVGSLFTRTSSMESQIFQLLRNLTRKWQTSGTGPKILVGGAFMSGAGSQNYKDGYDWEGRGASQGDKDTFYKNIDEIQELRKATLTCPVCGLRLRIDGEIAGVVYCACPDSPRSVYGRDVEEGNGWRPFLEREDLLVWRREHPSRKGMYEYKMYGSFNDISTDEFMAVQLDISEFRLSWDTSAAQINVVDMSGDTDVIFHWEVKWPRFFSNRDYCCHRSYTEDESTGSRLMMTRSVEHPGCGRNRSAVRVNTYHSVLVARPHTTPDQLGVEFVLTGFEDPGVVLPETIVTWVAIRGMPEFMINLRRMCLQLRKDKKE